MLFMGGLIGKIFREFAITLAVITILSGLISLTLTPMLSSRFIPPRSAISGQKSRMEKFSEKINTSMRSVYEKMLNRVFNHPLATLSVGLITLLLTLFLFFYIPTDFVPDDDVGFFVIYTQEMEGGSSARMLNYENQIIEIIKSDPSVEAFIALSSVNEYRKGLNYIRLKPHDQRPPIGTVIQRLYKKLNKIEGVQSFIKNIPLIDLAIGQEARSAYQFALQGIHAESIYKSARKLLKK